MYQGQQVPNINSFELMLKGLGAQTCYLSWNTSTARM